MNDAIITSYATHAIPMATNVPDASSGIVDAGAVDSSERSGGQSVFISSSSSSSCPSSKAGIGGGSIDARTADLAPSPAAGPLVPTRELAAETHAVHRPAHLPTDYKPTIQHAHSPSSEANARNKQRNGDEDETVLAPLPERTTLPEDSHAAVPAVASLGPEACMADAHDSNAACEDHKMPRHTQLSNAAVPVAEVQLSVVTTHPEGTGSVAFETDVNLPYATEAASTLLHALISAASVPATDAAQPVSYARNVRDSPLTHRLLSEVPHSQQQTRSPVAEAGADADLQAARVPLLRVPPSSSSSDSSIQQRQRTSREDLAHVATTSHSDIFNRQAVAEGGSDPAAAKGGSDHQLPRNSFDPLTERSSKRKPSGQCSLQASDRGSSGSSAIASSSMHSSTKRAPSLDPYLDDTSRVAAVARRQSGSSQTADKRHAGRGVSARSVRPLPLKPAAAPQASPIALAASAAAAARVAAAARAEAAKAAAINYARDGKVSPGTEAARAPGIDAEASGVSTSGPDAWQPPADQPDMQSALLVSFASQPVSRGGKAHVSGEPLSACPQVYDGGSPPHQVATNTCTSIPSHSHYASSGVLSLPNLHVQNCSLVVCDACRVVWSLCKAIKIGGQVRGSKIQILHQCRVSNYSPVARETKVSARHLVELVLSM